MRFGKLLTIMTLGCILLGSSPARADVVYSIRTGDTLDKISSRYNVSVSQITEINPQLKGKTGALPVGLIVIIPASGEVNGIAAAEEDMSLAVLDEAPPTLNRVDLASAGINRAGDRYRTNHLSSRGASQVRSMLNHAFSYLGTPYLMGGTGNGVFDCSGFVMRMFQSQGVSLPRTADVQFNAGRPVARGDEHAGDMVFFETYLPGPSHVGIYLGNGQFIHASSSRGVTISSLKQPYYAQRYLGAKRVFF